MTTLKYIAAGAILLPAFSNAGAQTLTQEINVQHDAVVEHHDASRVALTPQVSLPQVTMKPLAFSERTLSVPVSGDITVLEPTAYADTLAVSPYSGYASLGYFPVYNLGVSAGYRFIDDEHSRLNAWVQYDGTAYKDTRTLNPATGDSFDRWLRRNTATIGANYHLLVGKRSSFDAGVDYTFARFNAPGATPLGEYSPLAGDMYNQNVNKINLNLQWTSGVQGLNYTAGFDYSHFGYRRGFYTPLFTSASMPFVDEWTRPVRENVYRANGAAYLSLSDATLAYLGVDLSVVNNTRHSWLDPSTQGDFHYTLGGDDSSFNHALLSLKPRYRIKNDNFTATIGALVQFTFNSGKVFHIAPDVKVSWTPVGTFTIWGRAAGGEHQNTLSSLYEVNYMTAPMLAYRNSHLPLTVDGGIVAGPFRGAYAEFYGGYAIANDWLMPVGENSIPFGPTMFKPVDMKGWHAGVALGYRYRDFADARVSAECAPQKYNRGYYMWRDRAKYVIDAQVNVHPLANLDLGLAYQLRACRAMLDRCVFMSPDDIHFCDSRSRLGNVSSLGLNAAYRFTPRLSVFLVAENLLNHRYTTLGLVESQGVTGLVGVAYKF